MSYYTDEQMDEMDNFVCIDGPEGCEGMVEYRLAMSGTGVSFPRCDGHFEVRWETQQRLARDYGVPVYYTGNDRDYEDYDY